MLIKFFKGTGPGVILLIIITFFALWINALTRPEIAPVALYDSSPMPLYGFLKSFTGGNHVYGVILSFLIVAALSFIIVHFNTTNFFMNERTFLPALFYILIGGFFPEYQQLNPVLPAAIFLILAIMKIMDGYHITGTAYNYFDAGILISTGSLFYVNLIWFGVLLIVGIALLRTGNAKELVISILGLLTPYLITFGIYYVIGKNVSDLMGLISNNLFTHSGVYEFSRISLVSIIYFLVLVFLSLSQLFKYMNTKKIKSRKTFSLLIYTLLISILIYFLVPSVSLEILWITAIPASYLLAQYFVTVKKKLVSEILFSFLLLLILLLQIWHP